MTGQAGRSEQFCTPFPRDEGLHACVLGSRTIDQRARGDFCPLHDALEREESLAVPRMGRTDEAVKNRPVRCR